MKTNELKALVFDVQGTATDFRSTLAEEADKLSAGRAAGTDWGAFVDTWRGMYRPALDAVLSGAKPWTAVDTIYREALDRLLDERGLGFFSEAERQQLNFAWQKIRPWPDAVEGLQRLKRKYKIATLSNADVSAVVNISKFGGLPWDAVFAAEMVGTFKPDPRTYRMALGYLARPGTCRGDDGRVSQVRPTRGARVGTEDGIRRTTARVRSGRQGRRGLRRRVRHQCARLHRTGGAIGLLNR